MDLIQLVIRFFILVSISEAEFAIHCNSRDLRPYPQVRLPTG